MKTKRLIFAVLLITGIAFNSYAQYEPNEYFAQDVRSYNRITFGYQGEFFKYSENVSNINISTSETYNGFAVGYAYGIPLSERMPIFLEIGGKLSTNFWSEYDWGDDISFTMLSLSIPINFAYRFNFNENLSLQPYTGLNFKIHLLGLLKDDDYSYDIFSEDDFDDPWKRFQIGWQIGVGMNIRKFYIGLEYGLDFMKIAENTSTSHINASIGLTF